MTKQSITPTWDQVKQLKRFAEDAVDRVLKEAALDKNGVQRVIERGGELQAQIVEIIRGLSLSNQYANEEISSTYTYPPEYRLHILDVQIKNLAKILGLDPSQAMKLAYNLPTKPNGAEGWFPIPSVDALAVKYFPEVTDPSEKYCRAVQLLLDKLAASRSFHNYREGQIDPAHLRMTTRTAEAMAQIVAEQPGDILIIPAQLGMRHRGRSVRRAREVFVGNEFGLSSLMGVSIALTHPERFVRWEELDMDFSGDEFSTDGVGVFSGAPCLLFHGGKLRFDAIAVSDCSDLFGSASGFIAQ